MLDGSIDLPTNWWAVKVTRTAVTGFLRVIYTIYTKRLSDSREKRDAAHEKRETS